CLEAAEAALAVPGDGVDLPPPAEHDARQRAGQLALAESRGLRGALALLEYEDAQARDPVLLGGRGVAFGVHKLVAEPSAAVPGVLLQPQLSLIPGDGALGVERDNVDRLLQPLQQLDRRLGERVAPRLGHVQR